MKKYKLSSGAVVGVTDAEVTILSDLDVLTLQDIYQITQIIVAPGGEWEPWPSEQPPEELPH